MLTIRQPHSDFRASACTTAVLPVGAIEQHGSHLPVGTDLLLAEALARPLAEHLDAYLLPAIAISASIEHRQAKGTVYLRAETLPLVIRDIAESLRGANFTRLILVNAHGGNWILKPTVRQLNRDHAPFRVILLQPDLPPDDARRIFSHPVGDVHGGEFETSLMLHLFPEQVRTLPEKRARAFPPQPMLDYFDSTELSPDGFWGWPEAATAEKGRLAFTALLAAHLAFLQQIETIDSRLQAKPTAAAMVIRRMTAADIPFAQEVRSLAGWNQTESDWRGYLKFEPEGCFLAAVAGQPAGTATTISYGTSCGWIGMVLVHPTQRRLGLGTQLLRHAIAYLQGRGVRCIKLDATPMGRKVYGPLGFVEEYDLARFEGTAPVTAGETRAPVAPLGTESIAEIARFDAPIFGANRERVLAEIARRNPNLCFVERDATGICGYLMAREGVTAVQVAPFVAAHAATAQRLLEALFRHVAGRRVFIDVLSPNEDGGRLMKQHGFWVQRTLTRMFLGENAAPGQPHLIYSICGAEKG